MPSTGRLCPNCRKPGALCVCAALAPIANRIFLLILQHPQERDRTLGSAVLAQRQFRRSRLAVGLSWPGLDAALGAAADPRRWAVLYLGAARPVIERGKGALRALDAAGEIIADQKAALAGIEGIVLLDGSWSQAKALWWRNPWLLRLRRLVLAPPTPSLYGALRREPRAEGLATIEAAALALAFLEGDPAIAAQALAPFRLLLECHAARNPATAPRRPDRRKRR